MSNFRNGKIYKLVSDFTELVYIGSTVQDLDKRFALHKSHFMAWMRGDMYYCSAYQIVMFTDVKIMLVESYPCKSNKELRQREQYWKDKTTDCCNKNDAIRKIEDLKEYQQFNNKKNYKKKHFCVACGNYYSGKPSHIQRHEQSLYHKANFKTLNNLYK
jgi:hypothetical protein